MNARHSFYWITTILTAFVFLSGGVVYLLGIDEPVQGVMALGYPAYFLIILGVWKVLGGIAILVPRFPRLKEWAYAGITFELIGAAASQFAAGTPLVKVLVPLVILGIAAGSWALRPASRVIGTATGGLAPAQGDSQASVTLSTRNSS